MKTISIVQYKKLKQGSRLVKIKFMNYNVNGYLWVILLLLAQPITLSSLFILIIQWRPSRDKNYNNTNPHPIHSSS